MQRVEALAAVVAVAVAAVAEAVVQEAGQTSEA
jgi:hypothetical protein